MEVGRRRRLGVLGESFSVRQRCGREEVRVVHVECIEFSIRRRRRRSAAAAAAAASWCGGNDSLGFLFQFIGNMCDKPDW